MATGTVRRLVRERDFGFVQGWDGFELFFHRSAVQGGGFDTLAEGQAVEFDVELGDKGPRAVNMRVRPPAPEWTRRSGLHGDCPRPFGSGSDKDNPPAS